MGMPSEENMARLLVTLSATCILLFLFTVAFRSPASEHWNVHPYSSRPSSEFNFSTDTHLQERLSHAEKLWKQSVKDRQQMASAYGPSSESNPSPTLIVYSFGVSTDSSFEAVMLQRTNCEIWGYDYTVSSFAKDIPKHQSSRTHFSQIGISEVTNENRDPKFFTIQDLMAANGHEYIDIVKMDLEGAEFGALTSLIGFLEQQSNQGGPRDLKTWMAWWSTLEEHGLRPVNNEDNWIGDVGSGKPRFMEYTLINVMQRERNKLRWG